MLQQMTHWAGKTGEKLHTWFGRAIGADKSRAHYAPDVAWWADRSWIEPYRRFLARDIHRPDQDETRILDRRFQLLQFAESVAALRGSTAECGVYRGVSSGILCRRLAETYAPSERHFGFDSFQGLPEPGEHDYLPDGTTVWAQGQLAVSQDQVAALLAEFPFCELVPGWLPDSLAAASEHEFRFVHIDVDLYESTRGCLEFFYPKLVPGGVILFDDHGFADCPGARLAANEYFAEKEDQVIDLATGQGVVVKR